MPLEDQLLAPLRIGARIQDIRRARGLSQDQVATYVGVGRRTIQGIERGTTNARLTWLLGIAEALEVEVHVLIDLSEDAWQPPDAARPRRWWRRPREEGPGSRES